MIKVVWIDASGDEITTQISNPTWSACGVYDNFYYIVYGNQQQLMIATSRIVTIEIDRS